MWEKDLRNICVAENETLPPMTFGSKWDIQRAGEVRQALRPHKESRRTGAGEYQDRIRQRICRSMKKELT